MSEKNLVDCQQLISIIESYLTEANSCVLEMQAHFKEQNLMRIWREKSGKVGCLPSGLRYDFHGIGCRFTFTDQHSVDLDFGPNQRYDCFDEWRISHYIEGKKELSDGYDSDDRLAEEYKELIRQGIIVCPEWSIGGNLCCFKKSLKSLI